MISYIFFIVLLAIAAWCAYMISVADFRRRIIPDVYLWPLMLAGLTLTTFFAWPTTPSDAIIGAVFGYTIAAIIGYAFEYIAHRRHPDSVQTPIGLGDIKLMAVAGIWLGTCGLSYALIFACIGGYIWAHRAGQRFIPFAPFLIGGGILALIGMWVFDIIT